MPHQLEFTRFLNAHFGALVTQWLHMAGITPVHPTAPIYNSFAMELLVVAFMLAFFVMVRLSLSVERPSVVQQTAEMVTEFIGGQGESVIGHGYERYVPYLVALFMFILLSNLLGMIPGFESPTGYVVVPLGLALVTFVYYHYHGIRENKAAYVKQFIGPLWWLAPLMIVIEIISHLARVLSLTVRLYANIYAGDMVTLAFFSLVPFGIPLIFLGLHVAVSVLQAYVFMLLAAIYLSLAVSHEH
jgi:F-type H+-transporting ATPase subunit a